MRRSTSVRREARQARPRLDEHARMSPARSPDESRSAGLARSRTPDAQSIGCPPTGAEGGRRDDTVGVFARAANESRDERRPERQSNTTRRGGNARCRPSRTVSAGSSANTVPMPTAIASRFARMRCTSRATPAGDPPCRRVGSAMAPSADSASLSVTHGRSPRCAIEERRIELARRLALDADVDLDSGGAQPFDTAARDRARIAHRDDHARDAGRDDRIGARRRFAVMRARLERDVHRRATRALAGRSSAVDFGVRLAVARMKSFADDLAAGNDNGADHRVRRRLVPTRAPRARVLAACTVGRARRGRPAALRRRLVIPYQPKRKPSDA